jgi:YVTN family beta-propeller protein
LELRVSLTGRVAIEADGVVIGEDRFPGRQGRLLFAYLVLEQARPVPRDELAEGLWGEAPPPAWDKALTVLASKLRALLREFGSGAIALTGAFGCYRLDLPEGTWVDVVAAAEASREAEAALAADDLEKAKALAMRAVTVARRPFLSGEEGVWVDGKRRELMAVLRRALGCLSDACLRSGDEAEAAKWAEELIVLEPYRETGYRRLMEAHAVAGNRAEALRVYERCRRLLSEELGAYPSPETESVYRALLDAPSVGARSRKPATAPAATVDGELEAGGRAAIPVAGKRRRAAVLVASAAVLLVTAAIAAAVVALTRSDRSGLASARPNSAAAINATSNQLVANVTVGNGPTSVTAEGGDVWVTDAHDDAVARIDPRTLGVVDRIPVGSAPSGIAVCAGDVWVANSLDGTLSRIDPETNAVVQPIRVGVAPTAVACGLDAVWVTNADERSVTRIDAASGSVVYTKPTGALGRGIAVGGGGVWVTDESSRSVVRLDPASGSVVQTVNVGNGPTGIAFGAGSVWVANSLDGTVSRIDPAANKVTAVIQVGEGPDGIAAGSDAVWVSVEFAQSIVRIDPAVNRVVERIPVGNRPKGLALAASRVWFAVQPSGSGHRGGRLVVAYPPVGIDPGFAVDLEGIAARSTIYDGLLAVARQGGTEGTRIVPNLAVSPPLVTAGGTKYAFQLRRGIRYSNGTLVKASDFRRAIERLFRGRSQHARWFASLVGADACERRTRSCDLSRGVRTDDASGTIVFHLRRPDADFLYTLLGFAPIPPGTPDRDVGTRPVPSTGPYRIESYAPGRALRLVRNPNFRVWSEAARPDGFPDEIVFRLGRDPNAQVRAVERSRADVALVPVDRIEEVKTRYASQLHLHPEQATVFLFLNTRLPPFDDVRARRALNYAVDRAVIARVQGGPELALPTCQLRPPSTVGFRRYCPYTAAPSQTGDWKAPDLARARRLVAASGTRGTKVTVWTFPPFEPAARELVSTLQRLGYRAALRRNRIGAHFAKVGDAKTRAQAGMWGWYVVPSTPSSLLDSLSCSSIRLNRNPSFFCDGRVDAQIARALKIQATDPDAAVGLWRRIERELVDLASWVPLFTPQAAQLVSRRVGNYQYNLSSRILFDQLWVR